MVKTVALASAPPNLAPRRGSAFARLVHDLELGLVEFAPPESADRHEGRTADLRQALRDHGPATARQLAMRTDIPVRLVSALLQHDVATGRVVVERDATQPTRLLSYRINDRVEQLLHRRRGAR